MLKDQELISIQEESRNLIEKLIPLRSSYMRSIIDKDFVHLMNDNHEIQRVKPYSYKSGKVTIYANDFLSVIDDRPNRPNSFISNFLTFNLLFSDIVIRQADSFMVGNEHYSISSLDDNSNSEIIKEAQKVVNHIRESLKFFNGNPYKKEFGHYYESDGLRFDTLLEVFNFIINFDYAKM